jgi:uncharacterized protein
MTYFRDSVFGRVLDRVATWVCRHPRWFIWPQVALALLGVVYASQHLQLDMTRDHLIGANQPSHRIYLRFRQEFPPQDDLAVLVESAEPERNRQFIERLAARLQPQTRLFADLFYKGDVSTLGRKGLLLAPVAGLEHMRAALHEYRPFIGNFTQTTNFDSLFGLLNAQFRAAAVQTNANTTSLLQALPFLQRILEQAQLNMKLGGSPAGPEIESLFGGGLQAEQQIYVTFEQGHIYLLTVRPSSRAVKTEAIERLRQLISQVQIEVTGVDVGLTGGPVLDYDEMKQSEHDSIVASVAALMLCSLIFIIAYQQVERPLKAALCLLIGLGYTMGYTTLAIGHLNILSVTFAPMLIGLAIDFGVHFITRYEEEMRHRRTPCEAVNKATVFTGLGILTGGMTTAGAFLAMALTHFKGIREMGLISGGGLLLCLVPMMTTLAALLLYGRQNKRDFQLGPLGQRRMRLENLWLQRPGWVMAGTVGLCGLAAWQFPKVHFDYNLLHMQSQRLPSVMCEKRLLRAGGPASMFAEVMADSAAQARDYERRVKSLPAVANVDSAADWFGDDQERKLALLRDIKNELSGIRFARLDRGPINVDSLGTTLFALSGYLGLAADHARREEPALADQLSAFRQTIQEFRRDLLSASPEALERLAGLQQALFENVHRTFAALRNQDASGSMRVQDLPAALRDRFIGRTGKLLLQVYPHKDLWNHENQREFIQQLTAVLPADRVTGMPVELYDYVTLLKESYEYAALYALGAIVVMVFIHFRSLVAVMLSLLPVAIGATWLLGVMGATGVPFNPANIMTLPLIVGIGVTNGIQVLNRFAEEQNPRIFAKSTGKAVLVSGLTSLAGFATLIMAKHQGIRSLGEVMSVGIAACMIAGLTFLPALLCLLMRTGWRLGRRALPQTARRVAAGR